MNAQTVCFTGHRHLPPDKLNSVVSSLDCAVRAAYESGYRRFMCGGALGFDTLAARQVLKVRNDCPDMKLILVIPCADQPLRWTKKDQEEYRCILEEADERIILSPEYYQGCMQTRNRYMVDHSSLCICYLFSFRGGTAYTVRYAAFRNIGIINLAIDQSGTVTTLREDQCCSMFTFHSAEKNAGTAPLSLTKVKNSRRKDTLSSC